MKTIINAKLFNKYRSFKLYDDERNPVLISKYAAVRENGDGKLELITWESCIAENTKLGEFTKSTAFAHSYSEGIYYEINIFRTCVCIGDFLLNTGRLGFEFKSSPFVNDCRIPIVKDGIKLMYIDNLNELIGYNLRKRRNSLPIEFNNKQNDIEAVKQISGKEGSFDDPTALITFEIPTKLTSKLRQVCVERGIRFNILAAEAIETYVSEKSF